MSRIASPVSAGCAIPRPFFPEKKPRVSIRDGFIRKLKREATKFLWNRSGQIKRKKPLKKIAKAKRHALKIYYGLSAIFLAKPENKLCIICTVRREHGENILINCATEIHHYAGRIGRLLCYVPFWKPSCRDCREWPHQNQTKAREWGLLAPAPQFNVFPDDGKIEI